MDVVGAGGDAGAGALLARGGGSTRGGRLLARWPSSLFPTAASVVERFAGRMLYVQVGEAGHHHPALRGV